MTKKSNKIGEFVYKKRELDTKLAESCPKKYIWPCEWCRQKDAGCSGREEGE